MRSKLLKVVFLLVFIFNLCGCMDIFVTVKNNNTTLDHEHDFELIEETPKTCTTDGYKKEKCSICGYIKEEVIPASHELVIVNAIPETCTEEGLSRKVYCSVCGQVLEDAEVIEPHGHTESTDFIIDVAPTCKSAGLEHTYCVECGIKMNTFEMPTSEHTIEGYTKPATCTEDGFMSGGICKVCGKIILGTTILPALGHDYKSAGKETNSLGHTYDRYTCTRCGNSYYQNLSTDYTKVYGYNYILTNYENGLKYAKFYKWLYDNAMLYKDSQENFTPTLDDDSNELEYITLVGYNFGSEGLSIDECAAIYHVFFYDCPEFYYLYNGYSYSTDNTFYLCLSTYFKDYSIRKECTEKINEMAYEASLYINGEEREEYILKGIHDYLINEIDYAYIKDENGDYLLDINGNKQAEIEIWAHNIVGVARNMNAVCEGYAKAYLYLSYLYDINSIMVHGAGHAWNYSYVNNTWYAMDVTWDDPNDSRSPYYNYFLSSNFTDEGHTMYTCDMNNGLRYQYEIPEISSTGSNVNTYTGTIKFLKNKKYLLQLV